MRLHSLKKDGNDDTVFRHGRTKHVGTMFTEFYQPVPFFFTRDRMPLHLTGQYRGWSIFLIANGPSVASGKYDLSLLKKPGVMTYGMNNGPRTIRPNFWSCVDDPKRFIKSVWLDPVVTKVVPHAHANKPLFDNERWEDMVVDGKPVLVGDCPNVVYFHRNEKFHAERFLYEDTINWGNSGENGGGRSVLLPCFRVIFLLGFRKVYLLGADFNMSETQTYHFDEQRSKGAINCNLGTYKRMKDEYFPQLKPYFDAEGFEVYNCNPDSQLKVFPYKDYYEAIEETVGPLGNIENERTWGMYSKPEERAKWKEEPGKEDKTHLRTIGGIKSPVYADGKKVNVEKCEEKKETKEIKEVKEPKVEKVPEIKNEGIKWGNLAKKQASGNENPNANAISLNKVTNIVQTNPQPKIKEVKKFDTMVNNEANVSPNINNIQKSLSVKVLNENGVEEKRVLIPNAEELEMEDGMNKEDNGDMNGDMNRDENIEEVKTPVFNMTDIKEKIHEVKEVVDVKYENKVTAVPEKTVSKAGYIDRIVKSRPCGNVVVPNVQKSRKNVVIEDNGK